ncbi:MAG: 2Fe-2S iron-sulfur cluster binding domain-containing protein [Myxococcales bacterium]|nr:2Fe-2S iron-sulfur cluster binding domain-containing protein [Myxococcales bacterium]
MDEGTGTRITYDGAVYRVQPGESALEALIRGGANIAFSCRKGSCQTCLVRAVEGTPPPGSQRGLRQALVDTKHFLPCAAHPTEPLVIGPPERSVLFLNALVAEKISRSPRVVQLSLEPELTLDWRPGQYVNLRGPSGLVRSYSIASVAHHDYYVELHVGLVPDGTMSRWIHDELKAGDYVEIQGPLGDCTYRDELRDRELLMLATGTGIAPIIGIVRDALERGHRGAIHVIHAASAPEEAYLQGVFEGLCQRHENLSFEQLVGGGDAVAACFDARPDLKGTVLYLCGNPEMVYAARVRAVESGVDRREVISDPFEDAYPYWPRDKQKLEAWPVEPALWEALERGPKLRRILTEFYDLAYEDPRLAPFFHNVTKERAIAKQYEFLADVFGGEIEFFGLKPFNAHHWMIISDDLFDHREEVFEAVVRRHGLEEQLIRRWMAFHELFRRDLVKGVQRGMIINGVEHLHDGYSEEVLPMDMVCDGCGDEMLEGSRGRMHRRTGQLYCGRCSGARLSSFPSAMT